MKYLVVGFGSIGSRHAQSLISGGKDVYIFDPSDESYRQGLERIQALPSVAKRITSLEQSASLGIDRVVLSSSARERFSIFQKLVQLGIKNFLLEKIVFQSGEQFKQAIHLVEQKDIKTYCNFPNRYFPKYVNILNQGSVHNLRMSVVAGDIGMVTSAVHYMDLFEYLSGEKIQSSSGSLVRSPKDNKRGNHYQEYFGSMKFLTKSKQSLHLFFDSGHAAAPSIVLDADEIQLQISESSGRCVSVKENQYHWDEFEIIPNSRLTNQIFQDIQEEKCKLPSIIDVENIHRHIFHLISASEGKEFKEDTLFPIT
ncbi:hypothetical protein LPTSP4_03180 [Leptospira ryugenii]|uniref:Oxidoreductase, NAD-binding domain protein n=1 Tax=Leptospira ryugenii TaxID=1917863 RepID=A0A2P2DW00_9LEPT|nr:Gfo/Idh/MocA family oxidoreductase [Leptospira ryugenii]GBF48818.1 hypothetical protein LPTSP4_03180 [Leptospira ryugenii]